MRVLNSSPKEIVRVRKNGQCVLVTLLESAMVGHWVRVYKKPNGRYVGKLDMGAPEDWEFMFSFPYEGKN